MGEDKDFKVIDKRHSSGYVEDEKPKAQGEGFVMGDAKNTEPNPASIDFSTLVFSFATGALISMGLAPDPATKKTGKNLEMAKQNIDILTMLQMKTKGNLTPEENKLLDDLLMEVRLRFVDATK